jgi:PadR family transcriptional regulator AphA
MSKENKSKYALLGILSISPGSGYDIKKLMEQSTSNFWNESYGQIYPILKQLVEQRLATSHTEKQEGKPERYVYTLTAKGLEELRHWLTEPI